MTRIGFTGVWCLLFMGITGEGNAGDSKPIVAVFDVEAKGLPIEADTLERLSVYLSTALAETGVYQVVPREQLRQRLSQLKEESYKDCYEQSCQIEIGREMAAEKSLATQVIKLGSKCAVTATLFDLQKATTDRAATAEGDCSEDGIIAALKEMIGRLTALTSPDLGKKVASTPLAIESKVEMVNVDVQTDPEGAEVFVEGKASGFTPLRLDLARNQTYSVRIEKNGYHPVEQRIPANERKQLEYSLQITEAGRDADMTRLEWISAELESGVCPRGFIGMGTTVGAFGLKWRHFSWTVVDFGGGGWDNRGYWHVGTRPGYPFFLGDRGQHQVRVSLGFEYGLIDYHDSQRVDPEPWNGVDADGFILSPSIQYSFQTVGRFFIGIKARVLMIVGAASNQGSDFPMIFTVSIPFGWSSLPD